MQVEGDSLATLEDVMAFIDSFDATQDLESGDGSLSKLSSSSGFSSDNEDGNALSERSSELLGVLEATMSTATAVGAEILPMRQRRKRNSRASSTNSRSSIVIPAKTTGVKVLANKTCKTNVYREKMKRELQYLRIRAAELEHQLAALRQGTPALSSMEKQLIASSWKRIAGNQLAALKESEAENTRLKAVLVDHVAMSKTLGQSLGKRVGATYVANEVNAKKIRGRSLRAIGDEDFEALASDLDATFERLDQVIQESGLEDAAQNLTLSFRRNARISATGTVTPYTEVTETQVTPFQARRTAKALWKAVRNMYHRKLGNSHTGDIWQTGNTFAAKCQYIFKNQCGQDVNLNSKIVLRKYADEENRIVLVWRATSECDEDPVDVYADETGWSKVQPIPGSFGHVASGSMIRTCIRIVHRNRVTSSVLDPRTVLQYPSVDKLTDLVLASTEEDMLGVTKAMETLLLDEGVDLVG